MCAASQEGVCCFSLLLSLLSKTWAIIFEKEVQDAGTLLSSSPDRGAHTVNGDTQTSLTEGFF